MTQRVAIVLLSLVLASQGLAREAVWIEGEDAAKHNFTKHSWYDGVRKELLSGNEWLSHYREGQPGEATWKLTVKEGGKYTWWLRCNPVLMTQHYQLDGGEKVEMDLKSDVRERLNLVGRPDHRFIGWVKGGAFDLTPGEHSITIVTTSKIANHGGIDCMCFVNYPWAPSGVQRPGEAAGETPAAERPNAMAVEGEGEYVWIEGEAATRHNFTRHGWYDGVNKTLLSGGEWLSHYDKRHPGEASYTFTVKQGGDYAWWLRCNPVLMTQHYQLDGGAKVEMDLKSDVRGRMNLVDRPDHRFMGWVKGGAFELKPGEHTVTIITASKIANHGGIDCMCLVNFPWAPSGAAKPVLAETAVAAGPATWFPVFPDDDAFSGKSIIDMSRLLHRPAGKFGFVQRKGKDFVLEQTGKPVKFWGMVAGMTSAVNLRDQQARLYAKHGVNMVRQHPVEAVVGVLHRNQRGGRRELDKARLETWDKWFATLKKHGIYMTWSCFYPHTVTEEDGYAPELFAELPKRGEGRSSSGLVNFMRPLQDAEWAWQEAILLHKNPHTGLRYIDDPALAVIEVHNEDCVFWHAPLNTLQEGKKFPRHSAVLKRMWSDWLHKRYGTDARLKAAWGSGMQRGDSVSNQSMGIYGAWEMDADGPRRNKRERKRMADFIRFLAETQRAYYQRRYKRLRDLGYKGVVLSTAWRAGGAAADPANLWCDDAMDCITRHNYLGGGAGGHDIKEGKVSNETHMGQAGSHLLSSGFYQVEDKPFIITEWTQKPPNQWKAEAAPLFAFYGMGLQGWDASYHFAGNRPRIGSGWPNMRSYVTETPHYLGQFPALSFAVHKGHIAEAPIAAARRVTPDAVFQGIDALSQDFTGGGYDNKELRGSLATPKEVLAIGRVTVKIADGLERSAAVDWGKHWDRQKEVVRSITGQLTWDYGRRVVTVHSPRTQGVIGFAGGGAYDLPGVRVAVKTPFVSLLFTPLDDQPLVESKHILITAMARDKQTGTQYNADGSQLLKPGRPPLLLEPVQATLTFKGSPLAAVRVVDIYGVPTDRQVAREGNAVPIDGRYATYYYEATR